MYSRGKASSIDAGQQRQMILYVYLHYSSFPSLSKTSHLFDSGLSVRVIYLNFDRIYSSYRQDALL